MTIETKYNIGDVVWFKTSYGYIASAEITSINVYGDEDCVYCFKDYCPRIESVLYPSKEELLKSL